MVNYEKNQTKCEQTDRELIKFKRDALLNKYSAITSRFSSNLQLYTSMIFHFSFVTIKQLVQKLHWTLFHPHHKTTIFEDQNVPTDKEETIFGNSMIRVNIIYLRNRASILGFLI